MEISCTFASMCSWRTALSLVAFCMLISLMACDTNEGSDVIPGDDSIEEGGLEGIPTQIVDRMKRQEEDWNNGDIAGFMKHAYDEDEELLFIGSKGLTWGYDATLTNYRKSYPDRDAMGQLTFDNLEWIRLGQNHGFLVGQWRLQRNDSLASLEGHYSLVWELKDEQWLIIADHSS